MTGLFPDSREFNGPMYRPSRFEGEIFDLETDGVLPTDIDGAFFTVGPDPAFPPMKEDDIFFNGDGAVSAFRFGGGRVDFQRRYVRTQRLEAQRAARRSLHGTYRNTYTNDPSVAGLNNSTANTNVMQHNGVLLAMKEDSLPYALNPQTLETIGLWDFGGQLTNAPFTAHPKIDPLTGDLLAFGYEARGDGTRDIVYYEFDKAGRKTRETWIEAPVSAMVHDFAVTEHYVVFPIIPLTVDVERMKRGGRHFEWQPDLPQYFGVMRRDGGGRDVRWFTAPNGFQGHVLNAFDDGGKVYADMSSTNGNVFYFFPQADGFVPSPETLVSQLVRWTFDMTSNSGGLEMTPLTPFPAEFPRVDDRYALRPHRHGWMMAMDPTLPFAEERVGPRPFQFFNQLAHVDIASGRTQTWFADDTSCFQEPVFVPRTGSTVEGDGYLMSLVNRLDERTTDLVVLDALRLSEGPIATVKLPMRLRMALHGNWTAAGAQTGVEAA
ncbi:carotenoid oxygenase family protein [soil metagenome]